MAHCNVGKNDVWPEGNFEAYVKNNLKGWGSFPIAGAQDAVEEACEVGIFGIQDFKCNECNQDTNIDLSDIAPEMGSVSQRIATTPTPDCGRSLALALTVVARNHESEASQNCCIVPYSVSVAAGEAVKEIRRLKSGESGASEETYLKYATQVFDYTKKNPYHLKKKIILFVDECGGNECQLVVVLNACYNVRVSDYVSGFAVFCTKTPVTKTAPLRQNNGLTFLLNVWHDGLKTGGSKSNRIGRFGSVFAQSGSQRLHRLIYDNLEDLINPQRCKSGDSWCALLWIGVDFFLTQWRRDYRFFRGRCQKMKGTADVRCNAKFYKLGSLYSIHPSDASRTTVTRPEFEQLLIQRLRRDCDQVFDNLTELCYHRNAEPFCSYTRFDQIMTTMKKDFNQNIPCVLPKLLLDGLVSVSYAEFAKTTSNYRLVSECIEQSSSSRRLSVGNVATAVDSSGGLPQQLVEKDSVTGTPKKGQVGHGEEEQLLVGETMEDPAEEAKSAEGEVAEGEDDSSDDDDLSDEDYSLEPMAITDPMEKWGTEVQEIPAYDEQEDQKRLDFRNAKFVDPEYMRQFGLQPGVDVFKTMIKIAQDELNDQLTNPISFDEELRLKTMYTREVRRIRSFENSVLVYMNREYYACYTATYLSLKYDKKQWWALAAHKMPDGKPIYSEVKVTKQWISENFAAGVMDAVKADVANGDYFALPKNNPVTDNFEGKGQIVKLKYVPAQTSREEDFEYTNGKRFRRSMLTTVTKPEHFLACNAEEIEWKISIEEAKTNFDSIFLDAVIQRQNNKRRRFVSIPAGDAKICDVSSAGDGPPIMYPQGNRPVCLWASFSSPLSYYSNLQEIPSRIFTAGTSADYGANQWSLLLKLCYQHLSGRFQVTAIPSGAGVIWTYKNHHPHDIIVCVLFDTSGSRGHAVTVTSGYIFDGNETNALNLSQCNLDRCVSTPLNKYSCVHIAHGYVLFSPGRMVRSALNNLVKGFIFRGQTGISDLFKVRADAWNVAKCPMSLEAEGKHLNIINIIAGLFEKEPFKFRKITKWASTIVRNPFALDSDCQRRKEDLLLMEVIDASGNALEAIVAVGSTWFGEGFVGGRSFCLEDLQSYLRERKLAEEYHGVIRCTVITTPRKNGDIKSLHFLKTQRGTW